MPPKAPRCCLQSVNTISRASSQCHTILPAPVSSRGFSNSAHLESRQRALMWAWLNGPGKVFREAREGSTNYLGAYDKAGRLIRTNDALLQERKAQAKEKSDEADEEDERMDEAGVNAKNGEQKDRPRAGKEIPPETVEDLTPFPLNKFFRSQPVLSDELKNEIYKRVITQGSTVREVSMTLHVEMSRVAAVIRLKTIEQDWAREGKQLKLSYARAITGMLPKTPYNPGRVTRHESINDLPVHAHTLPQIFHPTAESRHFTRADAGRVFNRNLLPADARIPHPDMIEAARARRQGVGADEIRRTLRENARAEMQGRKEREEERQRVKEEKTKTVQGARWEFRFEECSVDEVGVDGRARRGVGWRYGLPHYDRKRGQVKIPTSVP